MITNAASIGAVSAVNGLVPGNHVKAEKPGHFMSLVNEALQTVSAQQQAATTEEAGYAAGVPGATLSKALVASDRATVAWNATVAVRNEIVSAYQSIMNMQF